MDFYLIVLPSYYFNPCILIIHKNFKKDTLNQICLNPDMSLTLSKKPLFIIKTYKLIITKSISSFHVIF